MLDQLGVPTLYRRYINLFVNGQQRGPIYEDAQQPNCDVVDEWFPDDNDGDLHKIEDWFEFDDSGDTNSSTSTPRWRTSPPPAARRSWRAIVGTGANARCAIPPTISPTSSHLWTP